MITNALLIAKKSESIRCVGGGGGLGRRCLRLVARQQKRRYHATGTHIFLPHDLGSRQQQQQQQQHRHAFATAHHPSLFCSPRIMSSLSSSLASCSAAALFSTSSSVLSSSSSAGLFRKYVRKNNDGSIAGGGLLLEEILLERQAITERSHQLARRVLLECTAGSNSSRTAAGSIAADDDFLKAVSAQQGEGKVEKEEGEPNISGNDGLEEDDDKFCVLVGGDVNAGKSSVINSLLLPEPNLETDALPGTTQRSKALKTSFGRLMGSQQDYPDRGNEEDTDDDVVILMIDTPGYDDGDDQGSLQSLLRRADAVLLVTTAEAPLCRVSERRLFRRAITLQKPLVVIVNKMDGLEYQYAAGSRHGAVEKQRIQQYAKDQVDSLLLELRQQQRRGGGDTNKTLSEDQQQQDGVAVLSVSARQAMVAKQLLSKENPNSNNHNVAAFSSSSTSSSSGLSLWNRSNWGVVENYIRDRWTLNSMVRIRLTTPLGVVQSTASACLRKLKEESTHLQTDLSTIRSLSLQMSAWREQVQMEMQEAQQRVLEAVQYQQGNRGHDLLQRAKGIEFWEWALWNHQRLQQEWEQTATSAAVTSTAGHLQSSLPHQQSSWMRLVHETADSIATKARAQGQATIEFLGRRPAATSSSSSFHQSLVGRVTEASTFQDTKQRLTDQQMRAIQEYAADGTDGEKNEGGFVHQLVMYARLVALLNSGALASLAVSAASVATGGGGGVVTTATFGLGSALAVGSAVVTYTRGPQTLARRYQESWRSKSNVLADKLESIYERELDAVEQKVHQGVRPYTRFVEDKSQEIETLSAECQDTAEAARKLQAKVIENIPF